MCEREREGEGALLLLFSFIHLFSLLTLTQLLGSPIDVELACLAVGVSSADIRDAAAGEARDMATMVQTDKHTGLLKCRSLEICVCSDSHIELSAHAYKKNC
jgi:hypothetical protein